MKYFIWICCVIIIFKKLFLCLKVKICITLLIQASNEVKRGISYLSKTGESDGLQTHASFGQFIPKNWFKAFVSSFPFIWSHKNYWYMNRKDLPWEMFLSFLNKVNEKQKNLVCVLYIVLEKSTSAWCQKISQLGGLPNISFEPLKPVLIGTMFRNSANCKTGFFVYNNVVCGPDELDLKDYFGGKSSL